MPWPTSCLLALAVDEQRHAVLRLKTKAQLLRHPQGPDVVEGADQDDGAFAELGEGGLGGGYDAEGLVADLQSGGGARKGDDVGEGEIARSRWRRK